MGSILIGRYIQWQCEVRKAMDEYYSVVRALPAPLSDELLTLEPEVAPKVQEVRLRAEQPVFFTIQGKLTLAVQYLVKTKVCACITKTFLQRCFLQLCRYSAYAYEEELRQGFFTIQGGNRIGVAGHRSQGSFTSVASLNLRVARWITCDLPLPVKKYLSSGSGGLLVAGVPGSGKTTFLRTLVQFLSATDEVVCVVDERGELMESETGKGNAPQTTNCDVYTRCPKAEGICMALRCMNPRYIVCDELGTDADIKAVEQGIASGVCFLASVHCDTPQALQQKPKLARLLDTGAFSAAIFLDGRCRPGTVAQWVPLH